MPIIRRQDLSASLRSEHDKKAKARLRATLLDPGMSAEARQRVKEELAMLGPSRVYDSTRPARPGAISFGEPVEG